MNGNQLALFNIKLLVLVNYPLVKAAFAQGKAFGLFLE